MQSNCLAASVPEVSCNVDAATAKAISAAAVPNIPYGLGENGDMIIPKASIPTNLPVLGEGAYGKVLHGNLDELAVALKVPLLVWHNCFALSYSFL